MDRTRQRDQLPPTPAEADVEIWEPASNDRIRPSHPRTLHTRFTASVPGAVGGAFLVCALAFGATLSSTTTPATGPAGDTATSEAAADGTAGGATLANTGGYDKDEWSGVDHGGGGAKAGEEPGDEPDGKADENPDAPRETPKDEPPAAVEVRSIGLDVALGDGGAVTLDWGACEVNGFLAWKVIRATDGTPTYPRGDGDVLIGVIEKQGQTAFTDAYAPAGKKVSYAVFGLGGDGYARNIACASPARPVATPADEPKPEPKDPPAETPSMSLALSIKDGGVYLDWTGCGADGADYYKVVRSSDSAVSWPAGEGDTLVAAVEIGGTTAAWDEHAPAGKKAWYRVFCVRHTDDGYKVLVSSPVRPIVAPAGEPAPEPSAMWIEVGVDGGHVVVHWQACGGELFSHYRVIRKVDGVSQVVAEIDDAGATAWVDETVEAGGTYKYLVQSKGVIGRMSVGWEAPVVPLAAVLLASGRASNRSRTCEPRWTIPRHATPGWIRPGSEPSWPAPGSMRPHSASSTTSTFRGSTGSSHVESGIGPWPRT